MKPLHVLVLVLGIGVAGAAGVNWWLMEKPPPVNNFKYEYPQAEFKDDVSSNTEASADQLNLDFIDSTGQPQKLADFRGKKNVTLVFLRGLTKVPGGFCPTCNAQTARLLANHDEFVKRDTIVLVVFPGAKEQVLQFVKQTQAQANKETLPFPILLDEDFQAVERLGLRGDMAKPSTFILDKEGQVRFAYVGATSADRPSLVALFKQLDALGPAPKASE